MRLKAKERIMKEKEADSDLKEKNKKEKIFTNTAKGRYRATEQRVQDQQRAGQIPGYGCIPPSEQRYLQ